MSLPGRRTMPVLALAAIASAVAVVVWQCGAFRSASQGGLSCEEATYDAGQLSVADAGEITHTFTLRNTGGRSVRILRQSTSCGCVAAELAGREVAAGESVDVSVTADWSRADGARRDYVFLATDQTDSPVLMLTMRGVVELDFSLSSRTLDFGVLRSGQQEVRTVRLAARGADGNPSVTTEVADQNVTVRPVAGRRDGGPGVDYQVAVTGRRSYGGQSTAVTFHVQAEGAEPLTLMVTARHEGALQAHPRSVCLRAFGMRDVQRVPIEITSATANKPAVHLVWTGKGANPFFVQESGSHLGREPEAAVVTVGFRPDLAPAPTCRGVLRIVAGQDRLDVPIVGMSG